MESNESGLVGVGLCFVLSSDKRHIRVKSVVAGGPADRAQAIRSGDRLIAVDTEGGTSYINVVGMALSELKHLLLGYEGTYISLELQRNGTNFFVRLMRGGEKLFGGLEPHVESPDKAPIKETKESTTPKPAVEPETFNTRMELEEALQRLSKANQNINSLNEELRTHKIKALHGQQRITELESVLRNEETRRSSAEHKENVALREAGQAKDELRQHGEAVKKVEELQGIIANLRAEKSLKDADDKTLLSRIRQDSETIEALREELGSMRSLLHDKDLKLSEQQRQHSNMISSEQESLRQATTEKTNLQTKLFECQRLLREKEVDWSRANAQNQIDAEEIAKLKGSIAMLQKENSKLSDTVVETRRIASDGEGMRLEQHQQIQVLLSENTRIKSQHAADLRELAEMRAVLESHPALEAQVADLQRRCHSLQTELSKAAISQVQATKQEEALSKELTQVKETLANESRAKRTAEDDLKKATIRVTELEASAEKLPLLEAEVSRMKAQLQQNVQRLHRELEELQRARQQAMDLQQENIRISEDLKIADAERKALREESSNAKSQLQTLALAKHTLTEKLAAAEKQTATLQSEVGSLRDENKTQYVELTQLQRTAQQEEHKRITEQKLKEEAFNREKQARDAIEAERATIRTLRRQILDLEHQSRNNQEIDAESDRLKTELKNSTTRLEEAKTRIRSLEQELQESTSERTFLLQNKNFAADNIADLNKRILNLEAECGALKSEAERSQRELAEFYQLPNPCGVGMEVGYNEHGVIVVKSLIPDMSAHLSQAVKVGDQIGRVDGQPVYGMTPADIRPLILGKRASYVHFTLIRGQMQYEVQLKRGAFGPEYAVVSPEDHDGPGGYNAGSSRPIRTPDITVSSATPTFAL